MGYAPGFLKLSRIRNLMILMDPQGPERSPLLPESGLHFESRYTRGLSRVYRKSLTLGRRFSLFFIAKSELSRIIIHKLGFFVYNRERMKTKINVGLKRIPTTLKKESHSFASTSGGGLAAPGGVPFPPTGIIIQSRIVFSVPRNQKSHS